MYISTDSIITFKIQFFNDKTYLDEGIKDVFQYTVVIFADGHN